MAFASLTIDINARLASLEKDLGRMAHVAEKESQRTQAALAGIGRAGAALATALPVGAFGVFLKSSLDAADALNDMSIRTGVTVKDLASLQLIAEQSGTSLEGIGAGLGKLNRSASEAAGGNDELAKALLSLGVTAATPLERLYQLADAVKNMADPTTRAADLSAVLGKSYLDLIPVLQQGSAGMRESALASASFADAMARLAPDADRFKDQLAHIKINAAGAAGSILTNMIPSLNEYIAVMREVISNGSLLDKVRFFGLGNASDEVVGRVRKAAAEMAKASEEARKAAGGNNAAQLDCIASGGTWNGKTCTPKKNTATGAKPKLDTIDPFGPARRAAEAAELKKLTDAQNQAFDDYATGVDYQIQQDEQHAAALGSMREALIGLVDPIQKYRVELDRVDTLLEAGLITPDQATDARMYWQEQIDSAAGFGAEITKVRSLTEDLGLTFESAFEGAIVEGKALSDVLNSLAKDVTRVFLRKTVTEPLGNWASSFFAGLFPSALGNVFAGGVPVRAYAAGGVVSSPTVFPLGLMGEAGPEAIMPLKRGRDGKLGVTGGGGTTINMVVHANDANSVRASMGQIKADLARAVSSARRNL